MATLPLLYLITDWLKKTRKTVSRTITNRTLELVEDLGQLIKSAFLSLTT